MIHARKGMDNKGMTLVELLLAVTILAIIVVPLLHAFVSSARVNRKSRLTAKLTTVGQDVMEGLKAYSVEDLAYEFDYPNGSPAHNGFQLINPNMVGNAATLAANVKELRDNGSGGLTSCDISANEGSIKTSGSNLYFDDTPGKKFYYAITNVSAEQSGAGTYKADVLITIDPKKYTSAGSVSNNSARHNEVSLADLTSMDTTKDAFYLESGAQVNGAYMQMTASGATLTPDNVSGMCKDIKVTVEPDTGTSNVKVTYEFDYHPAGAATPVATYPNNPALSAVKYNTLENVYLFYMPSYNSSGDKITYENKSGLDINFVLVKRQITAADGLIPDYKVDSFTQLYNSELGYKCNVGITNTSGSTVLKTNVDTNLASLIPDTTSTLTAADILKNGSLTGVTITGADTASGTLKNVAGDLKNDRIFDVTIDIYEPGTINTAIAGSGMMPDNKRLTRLKGNMN